MAVLAQNDQDAFDTIVDVISGIDPLLHVFGDAMEKNDYNQAYEAAINLRYLINRKLAAIKATELLADKMKPALLDLIRGLEELRVSINDTIKWIEDYNALKTRVKLIADGVRTASVYLHKSVTFTRDIAENKISKH